MLLPLSLAALALPASSPGTEPAFTPQSQLLETYADSLTTYQATSKTKVGDLRPLAAQRGVTLDGALRAAPMLPMHLAANPFENVWVGHEKQGDLRIDIGAYGPSEVDIALPAKGFSWVVGRTYNARQTDSGGSQYDSDGPMGRNWALSCQPEIVLYDDATNTKDVLYLVYRADAYVEFDRAATSSTEYKAKNGAAGCFHYVSGTPDTWEYTDQQGYVFTFLGFNTSGNTCNGLLWKIADPDGNTAYVGDSSSASTAISNGWDGAGRILYAYDATRRYTYGYSTIDSVVRLTEVKAETKTGGTWASPTGLAEVAKVNYAYYGDESFGDKGDLKKVTITTPLSDSGVSQTKKKYYRYWEGTTDNVSSYDPSATPLPRIGYVHEIMLVLGFEGARRFDWECGNDATLDEDYLTAATADLKPYAESYFEYDTSRRVSKAYSNGSCGCGGGTDGNFNYTYGTNGSYTDNSGYDQAWKSRTVVQRPDGAYMTQYFDEAGQGLGQVTTDVDPGGGGTIHYWATWPERNSSSGIVEYLHLPDNLSSYTHSSGTFTPNTSTGVVYVLVRESSGNQKGFLSVKKVKEGNSTSDGSATYIEMRTWDASTYVEQYTDAAATVARPLVLTVHTYPSEQTSDASYLETSYTYTQGAYSGVLFEKITTTNPAVSTGNNGSNATTLHYAHFRKDLHVDFQKDEQDEITYHAYTNGMETTLIEDADTTSLSPPTGFSSSGTPLKRETVTAYNAQGQLISQTLNGLDPNVIQPQTYRSKLADERMIVLHFPGYATSVPATYYGPVRFEVVNHAGKAEVSGVIGLTSNQTVADPADWIVETYSDPLQAIALGSVKEMRVSKMDDPGTRASEERAYFLVPGSGEGTEGAAGNYDSTRYGYDGMGRRWRVKEANGTIRRTVFDAIGRQSESWIGTNDHSFSGGEAGTPDNMVKTDATAYDSGSDKGNSLVSSATRYVVATTTDQRVTSYLYDYRGRRIVELPPTAPYVLNKYDNMGRSVARGVYSSSSGLDASDNPTSLATNRMALSETVYDEMGRAWKSIRHRIDQADGSDDDTLNSLTWYDPRGRVIKVRGEEYRKTVYDRLGRVTDEYVIAKDDDSRPPDIAQR